MIENCIFAIWIVKMIQKLKHIGAFCMWIAMVVIIAHAVIPHHHHARVATCEHECTHDNTATSVTQQSVDLHQTLATTQCQETHDNAHCHACHFSTEATTNLSKLTISNTIYIYSFVANLLQPKEEITHVDYWINHYQFDFYSHVSLRGPPALA